MTRRLSTVATLCLVAGLLLDGVSSAQGSTADRLADIRTRGMLRCGVWPHVAGFAAEQDGRVEGFEVDLCRAVAAAIFGDASRVEFAPLANVAQFNERGDIDLVIRRLTWTPGREQSTGMVFGPVTFYDGQGFLVPRRRGASSVSRLSGKHVCVLNMERHPRTLSSHFRDLGRDVAIELVDSDQEAEEALRTRRCEAYSADISWLAAARSRFHDGIRRYEILGETISKEPLAPLLRAEDAGLLRLVRWTIYTLIEAEELGLDSHNVQTPAQRSSRALQLLGIHPGVDVARGAGDWVAAIITGVGNYGEIFDRNLGTGSPIGLDRGLNRLWTRGGLMYSPPLDR